MKIVINRCYGGFGISVGALIELIKRNAKCIKVAGRDSHWLRAGEKWELVDNDGFRRHPWLTAVNQGDKVFTLDDDRDSVRSDPDLIDVVEKMGKDSWGAHSELEIVEVPDGIFWEIDEYDGIETIHESHRSWP